MRCDGATAARLRKNLGFSQQDVADKAKCSKTTIERLERGVTVDYQTIHQVAAVLEVGFSDLLQPDERDAAGPEADFVPLTTPSSAREWMEWILRCDAVQFDIIDDPSQDYLSDVVHTLKTVEKFLPGTSHTDSRMLNSWRSSAVNRLQALHELESIMTALMNAGLHIIVGEYVAYMSPEEARLAAEDFVDCMEFTSQQVSDFDATKRVGLARLVSTSRKQLKVKVDDLAKADPASHTSEALRYNDHDAPF